MLMYIVLKGGYSPPPTLRVVTRTQSCRKYKHIVEPNLQQNVLYAASLRFCSIDIQSHHIQSMFHLWDVLGQSLPTKVLTRWKHLR